MVAKDDNVKLIVGGMVYEGWKEARVRQSMDTLCGSFMFLMSQEYMGASITFKIGDVCKVMIGATTVIDGYIDDINEDLDDETHALEISGRDKTEDIVDCCWDAIPTQWRWQKLERIAQTLCTPFGILVVTKVDTGAIFKNFQINDGDTVFSNLERLARQRGVLLVGYGDGFLTITNAKAKGKA
ncbi:unnamed protein product, partial [marine sediment metagenome]